MELDDISMAYSGVGINLVNEERGTLSSYVVRGDQAPRKLLRQLDDPGNPGASLPLAKR